MTYPSRHLPFLVALSVLCLCSGCYTKAVEGDVSVYGFSWWVPVGTIAAGIVCFPIGWWLKRKWQIGGFVLMGMSPILLVLVGPSMFLDRVEVGPEAFASHRGLWVDPVSQRVDFDTVSEIEIEVTERQGRAGVERDYDFACKQKDGTSVTVPIGDLMRFAVPEICQAARGRGIPVRGEALLD